MDPTHAIANPGLAVYRNVALLAAPQNVKTIAARLYGWYMQNLDAAAAYVHFYDALAVNVTVGTTVPKMTLWVPASGGIDEVFTEPVDFETAIAVAATTTIGGAVAPATGELVNIFYF